MKPDWLEEETSDVEVFNIDGPELEEVDLDEIESKDGPETLEEIIDQFAYDRIALAMKQYREDRNDLSLFAILFLSEKHPITEFFPNMLKAIYCYHNCNPNDKTEEYYILMLNQAAGYLSSGSNIDVLKTLISGNVEIEPFDFFELILTEMDYEQCSISPFAIKELSELVTTFIDRAEQDPYFSDSKERMEKLEEYKRKLTVM